MLRSSQRRPLEVSDMHALGLSILGNVGLEKFYPVWMRDGTKGLPLSSSDVNKGQYCCVGVGVEGHHKY